MRQNPSYKERLKSQDERKKIGAILRATALTLFFLYNCICIVSACLYRLIYYGKYSEIDSDYLRYFGAFGFWQLTGAWIKAQEGVFFRRAQPISPSLEIGICRGDISFLHFVGKQFDVGSEYLFFVGAKAAKKYHLWRDVYSDDLNELALKNEVLNSIFLVHIADHIENIDKAVEELARVLKNGGLIYFSGFSDAHYKVSMLWYCIHMFAPKLAKRYSHYLSVRRNHYNMFSEEQWRNILERYGCDLVQYQYFETGVFAYIAYFLHYVCFHNRCFDFQFFKTGFMGRVFETLFRFYYISIGYPDYLRAKRGGLKWGNNFFAIARKKSETS